MPRDRAFEHLRPVDARAVVGDGDEDIAAALRGGELHGGLHGLARGAPGRRVLDAVVERVADHMRHGIGKLLDDGLVDLGLVAGGDQPHLLAKSARDVADEPRHAREHRLDRLHADRHDAFLQLPGMRGKLFAALGPLVALLAAALGKLLGKHRLSDDKLADHVHEPVDAGRSTLMNVVPLDEGRRAGCVRLSGIRRGFGFRLAAGRVLPRPAPRF